MSMCKLTILLMVVGIRHVHPAQPQAAAFVEQLVGWGCSHRASVVRLHTQPLDGKLFRCMGRISSDTDQHSNTSPALQPLTCLPTHTIFPISSHTQYNSLTSLLLIHVSPFSTSILPSPAKSASHIQSSPVFPITTPAFKASSISAL